jgi:hypothetical protein
VVYAAGDVADIYMAILDRNFFGNADHAAKPILESEQICQFICDARLTVHRRQEN